MPRGVYERKPKGEKAAPAKKASVKKVAHVTKAAKVETKAAPRSEVRVELAGATSKVAESMFGFQILGANLTTLSGVYDSVKDNTALAKIVGEEITDTVAALRALRVDTFSELSSEKPVTAPAKVVSITEKLETKETKAAPPLPAPAAIPAPPTMPQGNSSFTPPAPPALPQS